MNAVWLVPCIQLAVIKFAAGFAVFSVRETVGSAAAGFWHWFVLAGAHAALLSEYFTMYWS